MIIVISPAKKLDFSAKTTYTKAFSQPDFLAHSSQLVKILAKKKPQQLAELMNLSSNLAHLNYDRYQTFSIPFTPENAKPALMAFKGDAYQSFALENYAEDDFAFAQVHLRILSGLYGLLKPLDLIQPYRLEMGTSLKNRRGKNLYEFWGDIIARAIVGAMEAANTQTLINLASNEYFKSVNKKLLKGRMITPSFKDDRNGTFKTISIFAKQARGYMSDFAIRNKITQAEELKHFHVMGYGFHESLSTEDNWVFTR